MKPSIHILSIVCTLIILSSLTAFSTTNQNPYVWKPRTTTVSVFKNGLGFFIREGDVNLNNGWCMASEVPPATFGTLAIYSHKTNELVDIVGSGKGRVTVFDGFDAPDTIAARRKCLEAYTGLDVSITYTENNEPKTTAGTVVSAEGSYAIIGKNVAAAAVPLSAITRVEVLELPLRIHVTSDTASVPAKTTIGMMHLQKGIAWLPEYTLSIKDETNAELSLKGTLINEAEDLVHCTINFVVGVPHFVHTDYLSPIAIGQVIRSIASSVAPQQIMSQVMNRAAVFSNNDTSFQQTPQVNVVERTAADSGNALNNTLGNLPQLSGPGASDYTVYTRDDLTIRKGEKGIVSLFKHPVTYSHIYRWNTTDKLKHYLVIHNTTPTSWTTGPCLGVNGTQALTEDTLYYTPKNGRAELEVSTAINIGHTQSEKEIERQLKAYAPSSNRYLDLVTLGGTLSLKNFEQKPCTIVITAPVPGKPISATDDGTLTLDPNELQLLQRKGTISWTITLKPGETKDITYRYERYVPSY